MTAMSTRTMRAYVLAGPGEGEVQEVPSPVAAPGEVVVDVERVGVCGTDMEFFTGEMAYLHQGHASYPMRLGHEWAGTVASVGTGVDSAWVSHRVMGDTMLGDGVCRRCRKGHQHVSENRQEVGVRGVVPAPLPSSWPCRSRRYTPCPTPSTRARCLGGAGRQRFPCRAGCGPRAWRPGTGARSGNQRAAGRHVRAGCRRRGAPNGSQRRVPRVRPQPRLRAHVEAAFLTSPSTR